MNTFDYLTRKALFQPLESESGENGLVCCLAGDISLQLIPGNIVWEYDDDVYMHLVCPRFARVMSLLFNDEKGNYDKSSLAHSYLPRKFREDHSVGVLGTGMPLLLEHGDYGALLNSGTTIPVPDLVNMVNDMDSIERVFHYLYRSDLIRLVVLVEGFWVFAYLCFAQKLSVRSILEYSTGPLLKNCPDAKWRGDKPVDEKILTEFKRAFDTVGEGKHDS